MRVSDPVLGVVFVGCGLALVAGAGWSWCAAFADDADAVGGMLVGVWLVVVGAACWKNSA